MPKKKKAAKLNGTGGVLHPPSPPTEVESPPTIPTPSTTFGASTSGDNTPKENVVFVEDKPEAKVAAADALKEKGNDAFKAANYEDAIKLYSDAIGMTSGGAKSS